MLQRRCDTNLLEEALGADCRRDFVAHHLDRDTPRVPNVARPVHRGHATASDLTLDHIPAGERSRQSGDAVGVRRLTRRLAYIDGRLLEEGVVHAVVRREKRLDLAKQCIIVATCLSNEAIAPIVLAGDCTMKHRVHHAPPLGGHREVVRY